jgi:uncharacterized protein YxeA
MKRLLANLILVIFVLGGLFHVSHMHLDQGAEFSTNQSYMSQYPKMPDVVAYPVTNIPF